VRWVTRRNAHVDRTACPWLIRRFIDPEAEFVFVAADTDPTTVDGHTFDMRGAEFGHEGTKCSFEVMVERCGLADDPALVELGRIIRDADVPPSRTRRPEGPGLDALIRGFQLSIPDDHEKLRLTGPLYDALYAYCRAKMAEPPPKQGAPRPRLRYARRVAEHLTVDDPLAKETEHEAPV
jgi:hypothetical protein